jgi:hypothetical protein
MTTPYVSDAAIVMVRHQVATASAIIQYNVLRAGGKKDTRKSERWQMTEEVAKVLDLNGPFPTIGFYSSPNDL